VNEAYLIEVVPLLRLALFIHLLKKRKELTKASNNSDLTVLFLFFIIDIKFLFKINFADYSK